MHSEEQPDRPGILIVDDDETLCQVLQTAMQKRGFSTRVAHDVDAAMQLAEADPPEYAIVDLSMPGDSGLVLVPKLKTLEPHMRIVVLTGYASVTTAVEAIKLGAVHYLAKPADADDIMRAFYRDQGNTDAPIPNRPLSVARLEWEHIQKVLQECNGNISETARRLNMHRRTLQRKLAKRPSRD
jgi:two-component system response regulator RegA